jgi:hypothetical protein
LCAVIAYFNRGSEKSRAAARLRLELADVVDRSLGDLPEPAEARVLRQLLNRCRAGLGTERETAGLSQGAGVHRKG